MNEPSLKLNRETGRYELIVTVSVDAEIFRRMLYRYVEENHIDPTDLDAWQQAVNAVARADKWFNHPHATVLTGGKHVQELPVAEEALEQEELAQQQDVVFHSGAKLNQEEEQALRQKALDLPVEKWDTLLTPIPDNLSSRKEKEAYYRRRHAEHQVLNQLKRELEPLNMQRLQAVASATNGTRLK